MSSWDVIEWVAWAVSALLLLWMIVDFFRVNTSFDEAVLLSSREGVDELFVETGKAKGS